MPCTFHNQVDCLLHHFKDIWQTKQLRAEYTSALKNNRCVFNT